jgi:hypothetical protein
MLPAHEPGSGFAKVSSDTYAVPRSVSPHDSDIGHRCQPGKSKYLKARTSELEQIQVSALATQPLGARGSGPASVSVLAE